MTPYQIPEMEKREIRVTVERLFLAVTLNPLKAAALAGQLLFTESLKYFDEYQITNIKVIYYLHGSDYLMHAEVCVRHSCHNLTVTRRHIETVTAPQALLTTEMQKLLRSSACSQLIYEIELPASPATVTKEGT